MYGHYSNGFLLMDGGIGNQPLWYTKVMSKFSSAFNKAADEKREEAKHGK